MYKTRVCIVHKKKARQPLASCFLIRPKNHKRPAPCFLYPVLSARHPPPPNVRPTTVGPPRRPYHRHRPGRSLNPVPPAWATVVTGASWIRPIQRRGTIGGCTSQGVWLLTFFSFLLLHIYMDLILPPPLSLWSPRGFLLSRDSSLLAIFFILSRPPPLFNFPNNAILRRKTPQRLAALRRACHPLLGQG